jgi:Plasmid pRiA4b ORF-3-like protein
MKDSIISVSITLLDVAPAIWRRIEVPVDCSLEGLHDVIQILMGWADYHLHHFQFGDVMYGVPLAHRLFRRYDPLWQRVPRYRRRRPAAYRIQAP